MTLFIFGRKKGGRGDTLASKKNKSFLQKLLLAVKTNYTHTLSCKTFF